MDHRASRIGRRLSPAARDGAHSPSDRSSSSASRCTAARSPRRHADAGSGAAPVSSAHRQVRGQRPQGQQVAVAVRTTGSRSRAALA